MDSLRNAILAARKPVPPERVTDDLSAPAGAGSIAPRGDSSFGTVLDKTRDPGRGKPGHVAHGWADDFLRENASRLERVVLAVRDAARQAEAKGLSPVKDEIYVTSAIRKGWGLSPDQLSKGLALLVQRDALKISHQRKGRHMRFLLLGIPAPSRELFPGANESESNQLQS